MEQTGKKRKQGWMDGWKERSVVAGGSSIKENEESRGEGTMRKTEKEVAREREREALVRCILTPSEIPRLLSSLVDPAPFPPDQ